MQARVSVSPTASRQGLGLNWPRFAGVLALTAILCFGLALLPGHPSDTMKYKYWTRHITLEGISAAYSGKYPRTYSIYPPVSLYGYRLAGAWYQQWIDPKFDFERMEESQSLTTAIKFVAIGYHLALGVAIFWTLSRMTSGAKAIASSAMYLLNPAVIFDVAYWGQPDSVHAFWIVAAFGLSALGWWMPGWAATALAGLSKPQAWILLPLFAIREFWTRGIRRFTLGVIIAGGTALLVLVPFIVGDRLRELLTLPKEMANTMPFISSGGHNIWWLFTGGETIPQSQLLLGPFSYYVVAWGLVSLVGLIVICLAHRAPTPTIFLLAAYQAFGWFFLATQVHENHAFSALPFLALALPFYRAVWPILMACTVTLFLNMLLYDPLLAPFLLQVLTPSVIARAMTLNAALNLVIFVAWSGWLLRTALLGKLSPASLNLKPAQF